MRGSMAIGSLSDEVVKSSSADLALHARILIAMGLTPQRNGAVLGAHPVGRKVSLPA